MGALEHLRNQKDKHILKGVSVDKKKVLEAYMNTNHSKKDPQGYGELKRITEQPIVELLTKKEADKVSRRKIQSKAYKEENFRLNVYQASAITTIEKYNGMLGPIGVGKGKTLISLMAAQHFWDEACRKIILCIPPDLMHQFLYVDIPWARKRIHLNVPLFPMGGKTLEKRRELYKSKRKGCYIVPYSCLSNRDAVAMLEAINPEAWILDEAHKLARRQTARTKRALKFLDKENAYVVAMSGTITGKRIADYHHLALRALGDRTPLPKSAVHAGEWGKILDADGQGGNSRPIQGLVKWARENYPEDEYPYGQAGARRAYHHRLRSMPGVVATKEDDIGVSLTIKNIPVKDHKSHPDWTELRDHMDAVRNDFITPNGDDIEYAIHTWKWLFELSAGFYNELYWEDEETLAKRKNVDLAQAKDMLEGAKVYHELLQGYHRDLRQFIQGANLLHLDTPLLVASHFATKGMQGIPRTWGYVYDSWVAKEEADFEGRPDRASRAVRVCDFKINTAIDWAKALNKPAIVWYHHKAIGDWLADTCKEEDLDYVHCYSGPEGNRKIAEAVAKPRKLILASITGHGTGKNLQSYQHNYFMQFQRGAKAAEQVIGRTHRTGQLADELIMHTNNTTLFDAENFAAMLTDSLYIQQTTGNPMKTVFANYDPTPRIFPSAVLNERGYHVAKLSPEDQKLLRELFSVEK